jgi:hypothetical protein
MPQSQQSIWPVSRDYVGAVQNPRSCFVDSELQETISAVDRLGMPIVSAGQFAYVFKLNKPSGESLAVRCFRSFAGERDKRYKAIDDHLDQHPLAVLASFEYESSAIRVNGNLYPLLVMEWVDGPTLDVYLDKVLGKREVILHLADQWIKLVNSLKETQIAHGDLQHGNIIVQNGALRLVDFDGMFVPSMKGWNAIELGHRHYQHPLRDGFFFDNRLDNFSALVIYSSLIATAEKPELWAECHDENLLFKKDDFLKPNQSRLFAKLKAMGGEHRRLAEILEKACVNSPLACPQLSDLVSPKSKLPSWMVAPIGTVVQTKTREVSPSQVLQTGSVPSQVSQAQTPAQPWQPTAQISTATVLSVPQATPDWGRTLGRVLAQAFGFFVVSLLLLWLWLPILEAIYTGSGGAKGDAETFAWLVNIGSCTAFGIYRVKREGVSRSRPFRASPKSSHRMPATPPFRTTPASTYQVRAPRPRSSSASPPITRTMVDPVVGSLIRHIYHRPNCEWAFKISTRNRISFSSPTEAQARGYRRCRVCLP